MTEPGGKANSLKQPREEISIKYMHRPPTITPNYGSPRRASLSKSKVSRVLLYDNATQDHMLEIKLANMNIERERICRLINLHKRSFSMRQTKKYSLLKVKETDNNKEIQRLPNIHGNGIKLDRSLDNDKKSRNVLKSSVVDAKVVDDYSFAKSNDLKLPAVQLDTSRRHVIFKMGDSSGITRIFQTENEKIVINDILPSHNLFHKLTDDPRFQSLESILVPALEKEDAF